MWRKVSTVTDGDHVEKSINRLLVGTMWRKVSLVTGGDHVEKSINGYWWGPCREKYQRLLVGTM